MARRDLQTIVRNTAFDLFKTKGFEEVTVLEICQACGITKPTFYKIAPSKGALLIHYYADLLTSVQPGWNDPALHGSWYRCIEDTMDYHFDLLMQNGPDLAAQLFIYNFDNPEDSIFVFDDDRIQSLADVIEHAKEDGEIETTKNSWDLAVTLTDDLIGYVGYWSLMQGEADVKSCFFAMMRGVLGAAGKDVGYA